jgi:hypothetical protein
MFLEVRLSDLRTASTGTKQIDGLSENLHMLYDERCSECWQMTSAFDAIVRQCRTEGLLSLLIVEVT